MWVAIYGVHGAILTMNVVNCSGSNRDITWLGCWWGWHAANSTVRIVAHISLRCCSATQRTNPQGLRDASTTNIADTSQPINKWHELDIKAGMIHYVSGWTWGVQVKLWDLLRTCAIPERLRGVFTTGCYTNTRLPLPLPLPNHFSDSLEITPEQLFHHINKIPHTNVSPFSLLSVTRSTSVFLLRVSYS